MKRYQINAKGKNAEIWLYQEVGGYWDGVTAKQFASDVKALGSVETINLRINSPGGDVFDGMAIFNILNSHAAQITVDIDGLAASIASVIAMSGDEIRIASNAMMMVHNAWGFAMGGASEMRKTADMLDKVDGSILGTYVKRTKKDSDEIAALMADETWMTADEALKYGFVDSISDAHELAAYDLSRFRFKKSPPQPPRMPGAENADDRRQRLASMNLRCLRSTKR